jgi:repressor LexA
MKLRPRQQQILSFIQIYHNEHNYPPTIREIGSAVGISSTSVVNYNLEKLEEMKLIERNREVSRGLRLLDHDQKPEPVRGRQIPMYGAIAAGIPIPVPDDPESVLELVSVPEYLLPRSGDSFALHVKGHSMIDALVDDGDIIIVRSQPRVETGQMAIAEILEPHPQAGATLKRFYQSGDQVELRPANPDPAYHSYWVNSDQVRVHGAVAGVLRRYE